jgi:hypothetical protein
MKKLAVLAALLGVLSSHAESGCVDFGLGLIFPKELGGIPYNRAEKYSTADMGYSIFYQQGHFQAEISVYTFGRTTIPNGPAGDGIDLAFQSAESMLKKQEEAGIISGLRKRGSTIVPRKGPIRFANTVFQYAEPRAAEGRTNAVQRIQSVYATGAHNHFIKLDYRFDLSENKTARPMSEQMVKQLIQLIHAENDDTTLLMAACCDALVLDPAGYGGRTAAQRVLAAAKEHDGLNVYTHLFAWPDGYRKPKTADLLVAAYFAGMLKTIVPQQLEEGGEYEGFLAMLQAYEAMRAKEQIEPLEKLDQWLETADKKTLFDQLNAEGLYE